MVLRIPFIGCRSVAFGGVPVDGGARFDCFVLQPLSMPRPLNRTFESGILQFEVPSFELRESP